MAHNTDQMFGDYGSNVLQQFTTTPADGLKRLADNVKSASGCNDNKCDTVSPLWMHIFDKCIGLNMVYYNRVYKKAFVTTFAWGVLSNADPIKSKKQQKLLSSTRKRLRLAMKSFITVYIYNENLYRILIR